MIHIKLNLKSITLVFVATLCFSGCWESANELSSSAKQGVSASTADQDYAPRAAKDEQIASKPAVGVGGENSPLAVEPDKTIENTVYPSATQAKKSSIRILAWNVESGGNDPKVIAQQLLEFEGYDIFALSEVARKNLPVYARIKTNWKTIDGKNQSDDHLQIIYDSEKLEVVRSLPLMKHGDIVLDNGRYRSPLLVHFRHKDSGVEFQVIHNHLARGKELFRQQQATGLREWAREQTLPTIGIGDFNFDYVFETKSGNEAFRLFLQDNIWEWVVPDPLIDTNWYDPEGDGVDNYIDSILDFAFVAGPAKDWDAECNVIVRDSDFPDTQKTSDHRPIELILRF